MNISQKYMDLCFMIEFDAYTFLCQSDRLVLNHQAQKDAGVSTTLTDEEYNEIQEIRAECIDILNGVNNE